MKKSTKKAAPKIVSVVAEYSGCDRVEDKKIEKLAKKYKGTFLGSGYCFPTGTRDMEFGFKGAELANKFRHDLTKAGFTVVSD